MKELEEAGWKKASEKKKEDITETDIKVHKQQLSHMHAIVN